MHEYCYYWLMVESGENVSRGYPRVWVRWVTQQVRFAVSCELSASDPTRLPHLRRLPLAVDTAGVQVEAFLRDLIAVAASRIAADADNRVDMVTSAVLADDAVTIDEPDLQTMLAWRLAEHHTMGKHPGRDYILDGDDWDDHECLDPEAVAADLIASGLVAPAWKLSELSELAAYNLRSEPNILVGRRRRRPVVSPLQMAFPI